MALTIYKTSSYLNWKVKSGTFSGGGVSGPADFISLLVNYYTKTDLQISGSAQVHFDNLINAYHNNLLGLEGGDAADNSSGESSGEAGEYYHLSKFDYNRLTSGGGGLPFQTATFSNPLNIDATTYKDWICTITGDTTLNLNNAVDGDAGMIELLIEIDSSGGSADVTFGTMFTKKLGGKNLVCEDGYDNFISWRKVGTDIVYIIDYVI